MPAHKLSTDSERFAMNVDRSTTPDGCWPWTGNIASTGYGQIGVGSRAQGTFAMLGTHRFALAEALGRPIAPGMWALHTCDNQVCVRNDDVGVYEVNGVIRPRRGHLWEGTTQDNTADRDAKGRGAKVNGAVLYPERLSRGVNRYNARFTEDQVRAIRRAYTQGATITALAAEYGAGQTTIGHIVHRENWAHVL